MPTTSYIRRAPGASRPVHGLANGEPEVVAIDFPTDRALIRRVSTPADNYNAAFSDHTDFSFSRASAGTRWTAEQTLEEIAENLMRLDHDPATGAARGLLTEQAVENLFTNTKLDGAASGTPGTSPTGFGFFSDGGSQVVDDSPTAPGCNRIAITVAASRHFMSFNCAAAANTSYHWSCWVDVTDPQGITQFITVANAPSGTGAAIFYLDGAAVASSVTVPAGMHLVGVTVPIGGTSGSVNYRLGVGAANTATGTATFERPQLEIGARRSSDILTASGTMTRAADDCDFALPADLIDDAAILRIKGRTGGAPSTVPQVFVQVGEDGEQVRVERETNGHMRAVAVAGGATVADIDLGAVADGTDFAVAFQVKAADFKASLNGGTVVSDTGGAMPAGLEPVLIGRDQYGFYSNGWQRQVAVYARAAVNDAELQELAS